MPGIGGFEKVTAFRDRVPLSAAAAGVIALFGFLIYSNTFQNHFLFDDLRIIRDNTSIRNLGIFLDPQVIFRPRALVNLTFALNYAAGGIHVFGYHLVNIVIHILNGILVFFLSRFLFSAALRKSPDGRAIGEGNVLWMSFFAALFFLSHPVQTQAVTYIVQRYASMAALFYLLTCLFYVKGRMARQSESEAKRKKPSSPKKSGRVFGRGLPFFALAALCAPLAYLCKQNAASLPAALLLIEMLFLREAKKFRAADLMVPGLVALLWVFFILAVQLVGTGSLFSPALLEDVSRMTAETTRISRFAYLCTQFGVLVTYIRLLVFPVNLNADHVYPFVSGFFDGYTPFYFAVLLGLLVFAFWARRRWTVVTFGILWFFVTLSVESSVIPIRDALFEHRLYLAMPGFAVILSFTLFRVLSKKAVWAVVIAAAVTLAYGSATYARNRVWKDDLSLWSDVLAKSPHNHRARNNLGLVLDERGDHDSALREFERILEENPRDADALINAGNTLRNLGRYEASARYLSRAMELSPRTADIAVNLALTRMKEGREDEALETLGRVAEASPRNWEAHYNLAGILANRGDLAGAEREFKRAVAIDPTNWRGHYGLGGVYVIRGDREAALAAFREAESLAPENAGIANSIGLILFYRGESDPARAYFEKSLRLDPDLLEARVNLGGVLMRAGNFSAAIEQFHRVLEQDSGNALARYNLAKSYEVGGNAAESIRHYEELLKRYPGDGAARKALAALFIRAGREDDAIGQLQDLVSLGKADVDSRIDLGVLLARRGDYEAALASYRKALDLHGGAHPKLYYNLACLYALKKEPRQALQWLEQAIAAGYDDRDRIGSDPDLDSLRSLPDFKRLMTRGEAGESPRRKE